MASARLIVTMEDGVRIGGIGSAVEEYAIEHGYQGSVIRIGVPDEFIAHGSVAELYKLCHMDADYVLETIHSHLGK